MTLDRSKLWTGDLNAHALEPQPHVTVGLYDTTLRDGEQTVGVVVLSLRTSWRSPAPWTTRASIGSRQGFPRLRGGCEGDLPIRDAGLGAEIGGSPAPSRPTSMLSSSWLTASVIESPISDGKLAALGVSREAMLERIRAAVSLAVEHGIRVAFFGVDSTRADLGFVRAAYESAADAGAAEVVVVDTLGIATPEAAFLVGEVAEHLDHEVPIHWHGHDDFGLATAAAVAAVQAGATWAGNRERDGRACVTPTSSRWRSRSRRCTPSRRGSGSSACARSPASCSSSRGRRSHLEARHRRQPLHARVRRRRRPVPRPAGDRAVRLERGAERAIVLGKKSGLDSIRIKADRARTRGAGRAAPVLEEAVSEPARGSAAS